MARYRFDNRHGRFTVQTFATGMLSFLGHNPTFAVNQFAGTVDFPDGQIARMLLELTIQAGSLSVLGEVKPTDRVEIEGRMRSEVLETPTFPEIVFRAVATSSDRVAQGHYRVVLDGTLSLHGVARPYPMNGELLIFGDGIQIRGATRVRMSDHGIRPVTALGGAIRLKDEVTLSFDLLAPPEAS